ncbi:MAG: TAXI family TRAP transporter solute-binding subunit [bacterium]|nr:TAXI family TRAP transporter solute-binding subunit [bacterium]
MRLRAFAAAIAASTLALAACGGNDEPAGGTGGTTAAGTETEAPEGGETGGGEAGGGDADIDFLTIAAGGTSGPYYQIGATISQVFQEGLGSDSSVQATGASVENVNLIADGGAELAFAMGDAVRQAMEGTGPFEGDSHPDLQAVTALYPNFVQIVTIADTGITSVNDLAGRRVGVGDINSGVELNAQMILEAHGMSYDDIEEDFLSYSEAIDQMKNGQVDAAFVTSGLPNAGVLDLATTNDVVIIPIEGEGMASLLELYPFFSENVVPGGLYDEEADVPTASIMNQLLITSDLSDDQVYEITKTFWENIDQIHASHNAAQEITLESITQGLVPELHPGAVRYYEEVGADIG